MSFFFFGELEEEDAQMDVECCVAPPAPKRQRLVPPNLSLSDSGQSDGAQTPPLTPDDELESFAEAPAAAGLQPSFSAPDFAGRANGSGPSLRGVPRPKSLSTLAIEVPTSQSGGPRMGVARCSSSKSFFDDLDLSAFEDPSNAALVAAAAAAAAAGVAAVTAAVATGCPQAEAW